MSLKLNIKNVPISTTTIDKKKFQKFNKNIYYLINVVGKRANQISSYLKNELDNKLEEFVIPYDNLEDIFENREQIEISKVFEKLPKPNLIAIHELLNNKLEFE